MITFTDALQIATLEKKKFESNNCKVIFTQARDCGKFWTISFEFEDEHGERFGTFGGKMYFDISKEGGEILDLPRYRPWNNYWKIYNNGKNIPIPEEYRG